MTSIALRVLAIVAALAALVWGAVYGLRQIEALGATSEKAAVAQQAARDMAAARARETQITSAQEESDREANAFNTRAAADRGAADAAAARLLERARAADVGRVRAAAPAASGGAPGTGGGQLSDVVSAVVDFARRAAAAADTAEAAGRACERDYDALTP